MDDLPVSDQAKASIDSDFLAHRAKLLDIAAYLDRAERYGVDGHTLSELRQAFGILVDGQPDRAKRLLIHFSDPSQAVLAQNPPHPVSGVNNQTLNTHS